MRALANAWLRVSAACLFAGAISASAQNAPVPAVAGAAPAAGVAATAPAPLVTFMPAVSVALQPERNTCPERAEPVALGTALWNGWGRDLDNSRYQPEPAIRASDVGKLALKWSFGYQGGGEFGQPTVVDGRL